MKANEAHRALDDAEYRFDSLLVLFVLGLSILSLQLGFHLQPPWLCGVSGGLLLGRWTEVVGPERLSAADRNQWLDLFGLQRLDSGAGGKARIGQSRPGQTNRLFGPQNSDGKTGRIGRDRH